MRQGRVLAFLLVGIFGIASITGAGWFGGYRINLTPSYPMGLWRIVPMLRGPRRGDLIFICLPPSAEVRAARERGYLRKGLCPGGLAPLITRVAATTGQSVFVGPSVTIDGRCFPIRRCFPWMLRVDKQPFWMISIAVAEGHQKSSS